MQLQWVLPCVSAAVAGVQHTHCILLCYCFCYGFYSCCASENESVRAGDWGCCRQWLLHIYHLAHHFASAIFFQIVNTFTYNCLDHRNGSENVWVTGEV